MKKRAGFSFIILILFSISVFAIANDNIPPGNEKIMRYNDFETDNVHILRLSNFSAAIVKEVNSLQTNINELQDKLTAIQQQLKEIKTPSQVSAQQDSSTDFNKITAQLVSIESEINKLKQPEKNSAVNAVVAVPPLSSIIMLNLVILLGVGAVFLAVRKNGFVDEKRQAEIHAQLHLNNAVKNAVKSGIAVDKVRQTFLQQGWTNERVERALREAIKQ